MNKLKFRTSPNSYLKKFFNIRVERVFPRGFERFGVSGNNLIGIEIGVFEGEHAASLIKNLNIKKLYLIDPYVIPNKEDIFWTKKILNAKKNVQNKFRKDKRIRVIHKYSTDAVKDIEELVDFIYIDGNHEYLAVREDINNYWKILKKGGVLGGHDVHNAVRAHNRGVMKAVFEFALLKKVEVIIEGEDWWIKKP